MDAFNNLIYGFSIALDPINIFYVFAGVFAGTVIGMLKAFNSVAFDLAKARPMELAGGVGQALITTIAGLIVAIPAMMAYSWFRGRVIKLTGLLEGAATDLLAILENRGA